MINKRVRLKSLIELGSLNLHIFSFNSCSTPLQNRRAASRLPSYAPQLSYLPLLREEALKNGINKNKSLLKNNFIFFVEKDRLELSFFILQI